MADGTCDFGIVARKPGEIFGYFAWPTVTRLDDGRLVVAASGFRTRHIDPFGKVVACWSEDEGKTWSEPQVVVNSPIDDRDSGIVDMGGGKLVLTYFSYDPRGHREYEPKNVGKAWAKTLESWTDEMVAQYRHSWTRRSTDGGITWDEPIAMPYTSPHGCVRMKDGSLAIMGPLYGVDEKPPADSLGVVFARSTDMGRTWERRGWVPGWPGKNHGGCEPSILELNDGRILSMTRISALEEGEKYHDLYLLKSVSSDGGWTWSQPEKMPFLGAPAHMLRHSSGAIVLTYGKRRPTVPFGVAAVVSNDEGLTWSEERYLRADSPTKDCGYPSSVELADGSIFTVFYQEVPGDALESDYVIRSCDSEEVHKLGLTRDDHCSLLSVKWYI